jgi:hypothetical protein
MNSDGKWWCISSTIDSLKRLTSTRSSPGPGSEMSAWPISICFPTPGNQAAKFWFTAIGGLRESCFDQHRQGVTLKSHEKWGLRIIGRLIVCRCSHKLRTLEC